MIRLPRPVHLILALFIIAAAGCQSKKTAVQEAPATEEFPPEMVSFQPYENNPVFSGTDSGTWDHRIRERGYILMEDGIYKMWYTGYNFDKARTMFLGYATSTDGIGWQRHAGNPIFTEKWTEDMFVIKVDEEYYMFAEGTNDVAHLMKSSDGIRWREQGDLAIRNTNGDRIPGPYGTPTVWVEDGKWYLFYERNDEGIWLATSRDRINWNNVQDEPVLKMGPEEYDAAAVAANQVVKFNDRYYLYYHGSDNPDWATEKALWTSSVAMSTDLINWKKYPDNPIVEGDHSSPILVYDGEKHRLYTMHDQVWLYFPEGN